MPRSHGAGPASRSRAGPVPACALPQGPWSLPEVTIGTLGLSILYSQSRGSKEGSHVLPSSLHLPCHGGESPRVPRNPLQRPLGRVQHSLLSKNHSPEPGVDHCACSPTYSLATNSNTCVWSIHCPIPTPDHLVLFQSSPQIPSAKKQSSFLLSPKQAYS